MGAASVRYSYLAEEIEMQRNYLLLYLAAIVIAVLVCVVTNNLGISNTAPVSADVVRGDPYNTPMPTPTRTAYVSPTSILPRSSIQPEGVQAGPDVAEFFSLAYPLPASLTWVGLRTRLFLPLLLQEPPGPLLELLSGTRLLTIPLRFMVEVLTEMFKLIQAR